MKKKLLIAIPIILLTAILLFAFIPAVVGATGESRPYLETDNTLPVNVHSEVNPPTNPATEPSYQVGDEIVSERGRAHRVYYVDAITSEAVFSGSPEFTRYNGEWVDYVFTDAGNYFQIQHPWSSVRFYDYYTEVWNEEFTEVKIYDDRWTVEYQNKQGNWVDSSFWGIIKSYEYVSDGIKLKRTGFTIIGQREEIYFFRNGSPCKITINQTCDEAQNIRFVWKPSGIVATSEKHIKEDPFDPTSRTAGLSYYDSVGKFVETIRWYDALALTDDISMVAEASAQGRKATVTFGGFAINAGGIAHLDPEIFYPDPHDEVSSVDGLVLHEYSAGAGQVWATIITAAGNTALDSRTNELIYIKADSGVLKWRDVSRIILLFDTSGLLDAAIISAAVLSGYGNEKNDELFCTPDINVYASNPASNTALEAGDYESGVGKFETTPLCDTAITYDNFLVDGYNDFAFNEAGIAAISKTAVSKFGLRNANYDVAETVPNWENGKGSALYVYMAEQGVDFKPKLVITYTLPAPPALPRVPAVPLIQPVPEKLSLVLAGCAVIFFSELGFWRRSALLFMLASGASLMVGLQWYDVYVTSIGLTAGLMMIAYSFVCIGFAFRYLSWRDRLREE